MLCKLIVYSLIKTWTLKTRLFEPHAILLLLQFLQVLRPITADQKWKKINKWVRDFLSRKRKKIKNVYWPRCGFRGGDLVTCHPLFFAHDFTQPNFVTEPLFPTSVSKFIRKYYPDHFHKCTPLAVIPLLILSNLATIFFKNNYRFTKVLLPYLIPCIVVK